jgi:peptidoglycan/xylan/chitin deacetylase (PgdA/CDA1 family)
MWLAKILGAIWGMVKGPNPTTLTGVERPPQFVLISFDNCTELDAWKRLADFSAEMEAKRITMHFTFFVSGVNFLTEATKEKYKGPLHLAGQSNIEFGGATSDEIKQRLNYMNSLHAAGHEVGSHAVGHFNAGDENWSIDDWRNEFTSYKELFTNLANNNVITPDNRFNFSFGRIVGFRAPYLATTPSLYPALMENGFRYDASSVGHPTSWPQKLAGIWRFNLAHLAIADSGASTISMDYNFYVAQSDAREEPGKRELFRRQMLDTYMAYFYSSFTGNRAPLHIGHHFLPYQGGIYLQALKEFARLVCGIAEVRCVTYSELADFMDKSDPSTIAAFQRGEFPHAETPSVDMSNVFADARL